MNESISNDLSLIITQAIDEIKEEHGNSFELENINFADLQRRTGMQDIKHLENKIQMMDSMIEQIATTDERYKDKVGKLMCFTGVETYTALSIVCEIGDFDRFPDAKSHFQATSDLFQAKIRAGNGNDTQLLRKPGIPVLGNFWLKQPKESRELRSTTNPHAY